MLCCVSVLGSGMAGQDRVRADHCLVNACRWLETIDYGGTVVTPHRTMEALQALAQPRSDVTCDGTSHLCIHPKAIKAQILLQPRDRPERADAW